MQNGGHQDGVDKSEQSKSEQTRPDRNRTRQEAGWEKDEVYVKKDRSTKSVAFSTKIVFQEANNQRTKCVFSLSVSFFWCLPSMKRISFYDV